MAGYYGGYMGNEAGMQGTVAGGPSFDINPQSAGDARRSRKGLTPADVERLIQANPTFEKQIRDMYLPGPSMPGFLKNAGNQFGGSNLTAAVGNMGGVANEQFFGGPQLGQVPPGFQNKMVF